MLINIGKSIDVYKILGLVLANSFNALSGALFVHYLGYFSIWASVGVLIVSLASLIFAESISKNRIISIFGGSLVYQALLAFIFELPINQEWNKCVSACLIVILLIIKQWKKS